MTTSNEMERQLQDAPLHFLPYVGKGYDTSRHRILMLGEANHGTEQDETNRNYTRTTVRTAIVDSLLGRKPDHFVRYIRNTEAMLTGKAYGDSDNIWGSLAYSVFFQTMYTSSHDDGKHADKTEVDKARKSFFATLDILKPLNVIVWGSALIKNRWLFDADDVVILESSLPVYACKAYPGIRIWSSHHPSRDFSYATEHKRWLKALKVKTPGTR